MYFTELFLGDILGGRRKVYYKGERKVFTRHRLLEVWVPCEIVSIKQAADKSIDD